MRLKELATDIKLEKIMETASAGATGAGAIASIPNPAGGIIRRMPTTPNLFGYVPAPKSRKKKRKTSQ